MSLNKHVWLALVAAAAMAGCPSDPGPADGGDETDAGGADAGRPDAGGGDAGTPDGGGGGGGQCEALFDEENPLGHACITDADCESTLCFASPSFDNYCTVACDLEDASSCPPNMACEAAGSGQVVNICVLLEDERPLPGDGSVKAGFACNWDEDCEDGDCAYTFTDDGIIGRCAKACTTPGGDECGDCFACVEGATNRCERVGDKPIGATCTTDGDCATAYCLALGEESICSQACGGENGIECAAGSQCLATTGATQTFCIPDARVGTAANGDPCSYAFECTTGLRCLSGTEGSTCGAPRTQGQECTVATDCADGLRCAPAATTGGARTCEPPGQIGATCSGSTAGQCATGLVCKAFSREASFCSRECGNGCGTGNTCAAPGMDTTIDLYAGLETVPDAPIAGNDDIDLNAGNLFSAVRDVEVQAGTFFVRVEAFGSDVGGYTLQIRTAAGGAVGQATELAESASGTNDNDDPDFAQLLFSVPVDVKGRLDAVGDADYYQFQLSAPAVLSLKLTIGDGTFCLPTAVVAASGGGELCKFDAACESSQCDLNLDACIEFCANDAACGEGKACRGTNAGQVCVDAARVGVTLRGEDCDYDWECVDGSCTSYGFSNFCTSPCGPGATVPTCPIGYECGEASPDTLVCLPEGTRETPFNQACVLHSDCVSGLNCLDGLCTKSCAADGECPGFDFPGQLPAGDLSCKACTADEDCGSNGFCGRYPGTTETVCVQLAAQETDCAAGFDFVFDIFSGEGYCVASQGSCNPSQCVAPGGSNGVCAVPTRDFTNTCDASAECRTELCGGGFCTKSCEADADCGCTSGDFRCVGGQCAVSGTLSRSDVEPNDSPTQAPLMASGTHTILGTLIEKASGAGDLDLWKVELPEGATLTATTRAPCGSGSLNTFVAIANAALEVVETDALPDEAFGSVSFTADATVNGTLFLAVADEGYLAGGSPTDGSYVLEVTITAP